MKDYKGTTGDYENTNRGFVMKKISSKAKTVIFVVAVIVVLLTLVVYVPLANTSIGSTVRTSIKTVNIPNTFLNFLILSYLLYLMGRK